MSKLTEASGIANSIEEYSRKGAQTLGSSSALQFPGMLLCPGAHTSEIQVERPERRENFGEVIFTPHFV